MQSVATPTASVRASEGLRLWPPEDGAQTAWPPVGWTAFLEPDAALPSRGVGCPLGL